MKKVVSSILLAAVIVSLSGCVVAIGNKGGQSKTTRCKSTPKQLSPTCVEIDAAGKLFNDSSKMNVYRTIAKRDLTHDERSYLIDAAMKNLFNESHKEEILMILAENPPCRPKPEPTPEEKPEEMK